MACKNYKFRYIYNQELKAVVDQLSMDLPKRIQFRMAARGFTLAELAKRADVSYSTLAKFMNGRSDISSSKLIKILNALDFDLIHEMDKESIHIHKESPAVPSFIRKTLGSFVTKGFN